MADVNEKYISKRVFAKMVKKSVYTIDSYIEQRKIKQEKDGTINASYLNIFIKESILKSSIRGSLYLYPMSFEDYITCEKVVRPIEKDIPEEKRMRHIPSIEDLIDLINNDDDESLIIPKQNIIKSYRENVLQAFKTRYIAAVIRQMQMLCSILETEVKEDGLTQKDIDTLGDLRLKEVFNYAKYDDESALPEGTNISVLSWVQNGNSSDTRNKGLNKNFEDIMRKLGLVDKDTDELLFSRKDLSPDFFKGKGDLYKSLVESGKSITNASWGTQPKTKDAIELYDMANNQNRNIKTNLAQADILKNGFYTIAAAGKDLFEANRKYAMSLVDNIHSGFYSKIVIVGDENYWNTNGNPMLISTVDIAKEKFNIEVEFANPADYKSKA